MTSVCVCVCICVYLCVCVSVSYQTQPITSSFHPSPITLALSLITLALFHPSLITHHPSPLHSFTHSLITRHPTAPPVKKRKMITDEVSLRVPLMYGWRRETTMRTITQSGVRGEVVYYAPCGKPFRQYPDIMRVSVGGGGMRRRKESSRRRIEGLRRRWRWRES